MKNINFTNFRNNMSTIIDRVNDDRQPILITRQKERPAVLMALEDFKSYEETAYLLRSPKNAARIISAIKQLESGGGKEHDLIECD